MSLHRTKGGLAMHTSDIELPTFGQWSPTQFDTAGLGSEGQEDWLVCPVIQTRDSGCLERSNFAVVLADLQGCDPDATDHEIHRFGHWGPGWFEIIVVRPGTECHSKAQSWEAALASYPVASDSHLSDLECEEANAAWEGASIRERIRLLALAGQSIFAARRSEFPQDDNGAIQQRLLG